MARITMKEVFEAFKDCEYSRACVDRNIKIINKGMNEAKQMKIGYGIMGYNPATTAVLRVAVDCLHPYRLTGPMAKHLTWLNQYKNMLRGGEDINIEKAKNVRIEGLYDWNKKRGRMVSCPFHEDKTPSAKINDNNTYKCFSCGVFLDSIGFVQKLNNLSFIEAVKYLNNI